MCKKYNVTFTYILKKKQRINVIWMNKAKLKPKARIKKSKNILVFKGHRHIEK